MTDTTDTLREVTDQALDAAHAALTDGWRRLSATDIDAMSLAAGNGSPNADVVGAEMGAITLPLGTISRIRRRRQSTDRTSTAKLVAQIIDYNTEAIDREEQAQAARDWRDELIRRALRDENISAARIADVLDMHVQRIYQIRRGDRS